MTRHTTPFSLFGLFGCANASAFVRALAALLCLCAMPAIARGQAQSPTTVSVSGGSQGADQTVPTGQTRFGLRVPLKPNAENTLSLVATDTDGRTAKIENLKIAQISLTEIVRATVTATRLSAPEVKQLVAEGVIDIADPENYNVSRFVVALVVQGVPVQIPIPVVRHKVEPIALGSEVTIGCAAPGSGLSSTERSISIPCGDGGNASDGPPPPPIKLVPFEIASPIPDMPGIPGVILIEGRIKTLKEFFKVDLLLINVSPLFTLTELTARLEVPEDALSPVAPAGGSISLPDIGPGTDATGQFIVRGDEKGVHTATAHFGGKIVGSFLPEPVPFSGSASTDLEVKGPPKLDVKVTHPDSVVAGEPYDLIVTITNTDEVLDALYTSIAIDVGGNANLIDDQTGEEIEGPITRSVGDIMRGQTTVQRYKVMPDVSGSITSCVGAADANIQLAVQFIGRDIGCAIGTLPGERKSPDGKPTVTVVPAHNTIDVPADPAIVALFSDRMIEPTITTNYANGSFIVVDSNKNVVQGTLSFTELFEATAAIFRPHTPLAYGAEYSIIVNPSIFNLDGLPLASGIVARFTTGGAPPAPDTIPPTITLSLEPPLSPQSIGRGQTAAILADSADGQGVVRVDLYLDEQLIDTKKPTVPLRFLVETKDLEEGSAHVLTAYAYDVVGNIGTTNLTVNIAADQVAPVASITAAASAGRGVPLPVSVQATDNGRIAKVDLFLDGSTTPVGSGLVEPFQFAVPTSALTPGQHTLRAVVTDGADNVAEVSHTFEVTADTVAPVITLISPQGTRFRAGTAIPFVISAIDDRSIATIAYRLDVELAPRVTGATSFNLDTTGLALGPHTVTILVTDTSGNVATLPVAFEIAETAGDTTAPAAVNPALITLGAIVNGPTGSVVAITGASTAAENLARIVITNRHTQAGATAQADATGAFAASIEAGGGDPLVFVVMDEAGNRSAETTIVVPVPATLTSIVVTPATVALNRSHTSQQLLVTGHFNDGTQQPLTSGLTYSSSAPSIASATAGGLVLPGQNGSAMLTVSTISGVAAVQVPVTVDFSSITGITASPNPLTLNGLGRSQRLTVSAVFSDSTTGAFNGSARFATSNPNIAIVDGSGLITSTGIGATLVTVAANNLPPATVLVVVEAVQPTELLVTPNSLAFTSLGDSQPLTIRYRYSDGTTGSGPFAVTYSSLDASVATVTAAGVVSAAGEGSTSIVIQAQSFSVSVPVSVTLPTTQPAPEITSLGRPIAGEGDTVAILGRNFGGTPAHNFVTINGLRADVIGASFDRVIATVPVGAASGLVQVRVGGQDSNTVNLDVYARRAAALLNTAPFDAGAATPGQVAQLGSATFYLHPGDRVALTADPHTISGTTWSGLLGPQFTGTLTVTVDGVDHFVSPSTTPVDLGAFMPSVSTPTQITVSARLDASGSALASRGLAILAGPPNTGIFVGERFLPGDTIAQETIVRFRVNAPDGTKFAATAQNWYRATDGGYPNGSSGGAILGGDPTPNDGDFRTFTVSGGEVAVTYSDAGVLADFGAPRAAVIALVPANAAGNRTTHLPVAEARVAIGALDSASILPQQTSLVADGVARPIVVDVNSVRDNYGNRIVNGSRAALTAQTWYRRIDGGYPNGSSGGTIAGGVPTPNDGDFRTVTLVDGAAQVTYETTLRLNSGTTATAVIASVVANGAGQRATSRPFSEGTILLSSPGSTTGTVTALPTALAATTGDNRSVITLSNLTDAQGRPVPDGMRIAVTARVWYRQVDGGYPNGSFGGTIVGGDSVPNDGDFRSFVVNGGQVTFTYSNAGLVLGRGQTATTVVAILPADGAGNRIGSRPFAEAQITQAGITSATVVATPSSTLADGARRPVAIAITDIRDALGTVVPDGTRIALTAGTWYRRVDGGYPNGSAGGVFIDGVTTPNDGGFKTYTVTNGRVDATFSAENIAPLGTFDPRSSVIAAVAASATNNDRVQHVPFAEGVVAVSSVATSTAVLSPTNLLADRQARTATVTLSDLVDAQGRPVPDGTKVAITAQTWYRLADGGYPNGSAGGTMTGGESTPNDGQFRTYTVTNGSVTAGYSSSGLFVDTGGTAASTIAVLPASPNANRIGTRPFAEATMTLNGMDSGTFIAPATATPGATVSMTLTNLRDTAGNLMPDGTRIAVTAARWYNRDGSYHNGSAGGAVTGGVATPNDGEFRTFTVSGGQVTVTFTAPNTNDVTSVLSALSADGAGNRNALRPFATFSIRAQTGAGQ